MPHLHLNKQPYLKLVIQINDAFLNVKSQLRKYEALYWLNMTLIHLECLEFTTQTQLRKSTGMQLNHNAEGKQSRCNMHMQEAEPTSKL